MQRTTVCLALVMLGVIVEAQQNAPPQTARQALMEMFSTAPGTFVKHLPAVTRAALDKAGALSQLQAYSTMASHMQTQGQNLQTFETGPVMLATEDPKTGQKVEITVVNDTLRSDRDDIELSFRIYKNGKVDRTPFMPQMTFSMKKESQVWTLNEISLTVHLPLTDPDLLKALTEKMKPGPVISLASQTPAQPSNPHVTFTAQNQNPMQPSGTDAQVITAMRTIMAAEETYTGTYPTVGFTCTLSSLDGFGGGEPNEHQAMLINSGLASGKRYGFVFALSGCMGAPAKQFHLTAAPNGDAVGRKAFCSDQTGEIRSSDDGNPATCLAGGTAIQ